MGGLAQTNSPFFNGAIMTITSTKIKQAAYVRNIHVATPPAGTKLADVLNPAYWVHVAKQFHVSDRIEVIPEDHSFFAELYVAGVSAGGLKLIKFRHYDFDLEDILNVGAEEPELIVLWRGPNAKHCVLRKADKQVLKEGFNSKAEANEWILNAGTK